MDPLQGPATAMAAMDPPKTQIKRVLGNLYMRIWADPSFGASRLPQNSERQVFARAEPETSRTQTRNGAKSESHRPSHFRTELCKQLSQSRGSLAQLLQGPLRQRLRERWLRLARALLALFATAAGLGRGERRAALKATRSCFYVLWCQSCYNGF